MTISTTARLAKNVDKIEVSVVSVLILCDGVLASRGGAGNTVPTLTFTGFHGARLMADSRITRFDLPRHGRWAPLPERMAANTTPGPNGCLLWAGVINSNGYGEIRHNLKKRETHRVAWELARGPIPAGMFVCHKCDVPTCINPDHLFLGTHADNMADMAAKDRTFRPKGEKNGNAKLTRPIVESIRSSRLSSETLAAMYGVSASLIYKIRRGEGWANG